MKEIDLLVLVTRLTFLGLFGGTLLGFLRRRDRIHLDVALMFAALAVPTLVGMLKIYGGIDVSALSTAGECALMCHPVMMLRLVEHFRSVPAALRVGALGSTILSTIVLVALPRPLPEAATLALVVSFVVIEGVAGWAFLRGGLGSGGVSRQRLLLASLGSGLLALIIAIAGLAAVAPGLIEGSGLLIELLALGAGLVWLAAFVPPRGLVRAWQTAEVRAFLERGLDKAPDDRAQFMIEMLSTSARSAVGGLGVIVALADALEEQSPQGLLVRATAPPGLVPSGRLSVVDGVAARAWAQGRPAMDFEPAGWSPTERELSRRLAAQAMLAIPIATPSRRSGVLLLVLRRGLLFAEDDLAALGLLTEQVAVAIEIAALIEQQRRSNEALARINAHKGTFLSNLSHELRTPLNSIVGFTHLIRDGFAGAVKPTQREYLDDVLTSAAHMGALINDALDLSRVDAGKLAFEPVPVDLAGTIEAAADQLLPLASARSLDLSVQVDGDLRGAIVVLDPVRLRQILLNLLSNAIKFTPDGGHVALRASARPGPTLLLEVEDDGEGIDEAHLGAIFEPFHQLRSSSAAHRHGAGLGLTLTRRLVEGQGGQIDVQSAPGCGSTFRVTLPRIDADGQHLTLLEPTTPEHLARGPLSAKEIP